MDNKDACKLSKFTPFWLLAIKERFIVGDKCKNDKNKTWCFVRVMKIVTIADKM